MKQIEKNQSCLIFGFVKFFWLKMSFRKEKFGKSAEMFTVVFIKRKNSDKIFSKNLSLFKG